MVEHGLECCTYFMLICLSFDAITVQYCSGIRVISHKLYHQEATQLQADIRSLMD